MVLGAKSDIAAATARLYAEQSLNLTLAARKTDSLEKIKEDFILNTDGFKAEHGFVSIVANNNEGFFITWLDGRNTLDKEVDGDHKPMTIRFAEITNAGDIINEIEPDQDCLDQLKAV